MNFVLCFCVLWADLKEKGYSPQAILVVSYVFPPNPGVGGRRWAKFGKMLARKGYDIHVVCSTPMLPPTGQFMEDIDSPKIHTYQIPRRFPKVIGYRSHSFFQRIQYKLALAWLRSRTKANYYDRAALWKGVMLDKCRELIRKYKIKNVVVSAAPFHCLHHALELKKEFPGINLIADLRDPWIEESHAYGLGDLSPERLEREKAMEREVIAQFDHILCAAETMTRIFSRMAGKQADKVVTLTNAYDEDDFTRALSPPVQPHTDNRIRLVHVGTVYRDIPHLLDPFVAMLKELKDSHPEVYERLDFEFIGKVPPAFQDAITKAGLENFRFHGYRPQSEAIRKIAEGDICLMFKRDRLKNAFGTKVFEYFRIRKPIFLICTPNELTQYMEGNRIGYNLNLENMGERFLELIRAYDKGKLDFNDQFDVEQYSLERLTQRVEGFFVPFSPD